MNLDAILIPISDETREAALEMALSMYVSEPCRICRRALTRDDIREAKFAGYSRDGQARAAHRVCWQNFVELLQTTPAQRLHELVHSEEGEGK